jgi:hypothetical protein
VTRNIRQGKRWSCLKLKEIYVIPTLYISETYIWKTACETKIQASENTFLRSAKVYTGFNNINPTKHSPS